LVIGVSRSREPWLALVSRDFEHRGTALVHAWTLFRSPIFGEFSRDFVQILQHAAWKFRGMQTAMRVTVE
jgi:hypothetical protein